VLWDVVVGDSVELDALPPRELRTMVTEVIERHVSPAATTVLRTAEESERELLRAWRAKGDAMSFAAVCRTADKQQRRKPAIRRKLMADDVSLERAHAEITTSHLDGRAADSTIEALTFSLRCGIDALARPDSLRRLSELSDAQLRQVAVRVQKFEPQIATAWSIEEVQVLISVRSKVRG
jgi:hypothetical protein